MGPPSIAPGMFFPLGMAPFASPRSGCESRSAVAAFGGGGVRGAALQAARAKAAQRAVTVLDVIGGRLLAER